MPPQCHLSVRSPPLALAGHLEMSDIILSCKTWRGIRRCQPGGPGQGNSLALSFPDSVLRLDWCSSGVFRWQVVTCIFLLSKPVFLHAEIKQPTPILETPTTCFVKRISFVIPLVLLSDRQLERGQLSRQKQVEPAAEPEVEEHTPHAHSLSPSRVRRWLSLVCVLTISEDMKILAIAYENSAEARSSARRNARLNGLNEGERSIYNTKEGHQDENKRKASKKHLRERSIYKGRSSRREQATSHACHCSIEPWKLTCN